MTGGSRTGSALSACRNVIFGLCAIALASCERSVLDPVGPVGADDAIILIDATLIMLAIVIPTILAAFWFAWWYRASNRKARYLPEFAYSGRIELLVWSIPILVVIFLSGVIWVGSHQLDPFRRLPSRTPALEVQVVSLDWKWLFIYPQQGIASVNELVIPAGVPVHFSLTSASVMNVFFVPRLGTMVYTMNRMVTEVNLKADQPGSYFGTSAQFSGDGFPDMQFQARSLAPAQFAAWVAQARSAGPVLDAAGYAALMPQSQGLRPYTYRAVDPGLFQAIASQAAAPQPGPTVGRGGPDVSPRRAG